MRKRKMILGLGMLASVLVLGVGYAVVSNKTLNIGGTATVAASELNVSFNGTTSVSDVGKVTATAVADGLNANITVTNLSEVNQSVTATYTIQNKEKDLKASILKNEITVSKEEYFDVTTSVDSVPLVISNGGAETGTVTVTIKLKKKPIDEPSSSTNITVSLTATPVQP